MYGFGFETWEYSPEYSLRSYSYIVPHLIVSKIISLFINNKIYIFYGLRICLSLFCAFSEIVFVKGIVYISFFYFYLIYLINLKIW